MARSVVPLVGSGDALAHRSKRAIGRATSSRAGTAYVTREQGIEVACPHCVPLMARVMRCCVCRGERTISAKRAAVALQRVWSRPNCECQACRILRMMEQDAFG